MDRDNHDQDGAASYYLKKDSIRERTKQQIASRRTNRQDRKVGEGGRGREPGWRIRIG